MTALQPTVSATLDQYVRDTFAADPVLATKLGVHDHDAELPAADPGAFEEREQRHRSLFDALEGIDTTDLDPLDRLDHQVGLIEAKTGIRNDERAVWRTAPYTYVATIGDGVSTLMTRDTVPLEQRSEALLARLRQTPAYFTAASANLTERTPQRWAAMGVGAGRGLVRFLSDSVAQFAQPLPTALRSDIEIAAREAADAAERFTETVGEIGGRAEGDWAGGADYFDFLLSDFHLLDLDHDQLHDLGRELVAKDTAALVEFAAKQDPGNSWQEQIARIKDDHPQPDAFIQTYHHELERARRHVVEAELATLPDGEICRMDWVPEFMRESLPIAVMSTTPPFEQGLESRWLITPSDPNAPADRRLQQMRDNCYVFAESIAGHEIYPGHHLQKVHHKLATADSMIRRYFSCPQFVEGWGLYVEDLFTETGFFDNPRVLLFKLRNSLWRSLRVVIDVGLHTRGMTFDEAASLLMEQAAMDRHMAEGEVTRYIRHDNPTYPSSYMLGRQRFHELRDRYQALHPDASLLTFHDTVMSFGSLPLSLVSDQMIPTN